MAWDPQESTVEAEDILNMQKPAGPPQLRYRQEQSWEHSIDGAIQNSRTTAWNCLCKMSFINTRMPLELEGWGPAWPCASNLSHLLNFSFSVCASLGLSVRGHLGAGGQRTQHSVQHTEHPSFHHPARVSLLNTLPQRPDKPWVLYPYRLLDPMRETLW